MIVITSQKEIGLAKKMSEVIGASIASSGGSVLLFMIHKLVKRLMMKKTMISGVVLVSGKTWISKNLTSPDILFIDLDAELSPELPLYRIDKAELRLKMYPKAKEMLKKWKTQFAEKHIVLLTSDWEVLSSLKVKKVKAILPSQSLMKNVIAELDPTRADILEKVRLVNALKIDEKHQILIQTLDEGVRAIRNIFKIPETII